MIPLTRISEKERMLKLKVWFYTSTINFYEFVSCITDSKKYSLSEVRAELDKLLFI